MKQIAHPVHNKHNTNQNQSSNQNNKTPNEKSITIANTNTNSQSKPIQVAIPDNKLKTQIDKNNANLQQIT